MRPLQTPKITSTKQYAMCGRSPLWKKDYRHSSWIVCPLKGFRRTVAASNVQYVRGCQFWSGKSGKTCCFLHTRGNPLKMSLAAANGFHFVGLARSTVTPREHRSEAQHYNRIENVVRKAQYLGKLEMPPTTENFPSRPREDLLTRKTRGEIRHCVKDFNGDYPQTLS